MKSTTRLVEPCEHDHWPNVFGFIEFENGVKALLQFKEAHIEDDYGRARVEPVRHEAAVRWLYMRSFGYPPLEKGVYHHGDHLPDFLDHTGTLHTGEINDEFSSQLEVNIRDVIRNSKAGGSPGMEHIRSMVDWVKELVPSSVILQALRNDARKTLKKAGFLGEPE